MDTKDFLVTKVSDQKDGLGKSYNFYRTLEVNDLGVPVFEEIQNFLELEENKNVTFFIGEEDISIISFKNEHKYVKNTLKEYKENWVDKEPKKVFVYTYTKDFMQLLDVIPKVEEIKTKSNGKKIR